MDITAASLAVKLTTSEIGAASAPVLAPDPLASAQFAQMMAAPPPIADPAGTAANAGVRAVAPENRTMGDNILSGLQGLSSDFQQSVKTVSAVLTDGANLSSADLLKVQVGLMQISVQYELIGKAVSRSTQNIDQLVKVQ
ncbi:MAG: type III secretion system inner rod subunit SctI [Polaromonas sp.]|nr:type III secretion system inner rod subunit SctI [Polaromonas sp.]